jgi:Domain of unknown function (DUF1707)/FHA domain
MKALAGHGSCGEHRCVVDAATGLACWTLRPVGPTISRVTTHEFPAPPVRPSDAERDRAIEVLTEGAAEGRLSHDTFLHRMDLALHARDHAELRALTADLTDGAAAPAAGRAARALTAPVTLLRTLRRAWRAVGLPTLQLPEPGPYPLRIGRGHGCGLRLADDCVSRQHAELRAERGVWLLRDLGSMNGTWVNGVRVVGEVPVRPGDSVRFGVSSYRLAGR